MPERYFGSQKPANYRSSERTRQPIKQTEPEKHEPKPTFENYIGCGIALLAVSAAFPFGWWLFTLVPVAHWNKVIVAVVAIGLSCYLLGYAWGLITIRRK